MVGRISPELCIRCKGYKRLCGLPRCPILERFRAQVSSINMIRSRELDGATPPSLIVGESGYPNVNVYFMVPPRERGEEARYHDFPEEWARRREPLSKIIALRSSLISAVINSPVNDPWRLYEKEISPAAVSVRPVDTEVMLSRIPVPRLKFNGVTKPIGPSSPAEKIKITSNPLLPKKVEKIIWDDVKAYDAVKELYVSGINVYEIQRALSLGLLGTFRRRRLVPTRWAITAVDDMLSRFLRDKIKDFEWTNYVEVRKGEYLGNRYIIILMPGPGGFEWIEVWHPRGLWTRSASRPLIWRVYETPRGEATAIDGGFSAARLPVLEYLLRMRKKADVLIIREIFPTYYAPVGNWHIRETVKNIMNSNYQRFNNLKEAIDYVKENISLDIKVIKEKSLLLQGFKQTKITDFVKEG
jgi:hypothetical protein